MGIAIAQAVTLVVAVYAAIGVVFAAAFVTLGVARVDHAARGAPWSFRALIFPGAAALWPVLLRAWVRASRKGSDDAPAAT
jgi:hypothetical protein